MINFKEHFKLTGLYTFFAAFPAILQIVVYPIIEGTDRLGARDFGYLAVAEAILSFLVMICLYGMAIAISRFYFDYIDNPNGYKKLVSTIFNGIILRSLLVLAVIFIFADYIGTFFSDVVLSNFRSYGYFLIIIAFNRTVIAVALALYRNEKRIRNFIAVALISGISRSTMQIVGVLYFDLSFKGYLMGTSIGGGVAALAIILYTYRTCGFHFSKEIIRKLRGYTFPLFLTDIVFWGILFFDRFMLLGNTEALGIYDNALKFAIGVQLISQGLASSIQPELFRLFNLGAQQHQKDIKTLSNLFIAENITIIAAFLLPVMIFVDLFYETALIQSAGLFALIFMRYVLYAQYQVFLWPILYMKRSSIFLGINLVVLTVVVSMNFLLVPEFGYYGSIGASILAGFTQVMLSHFFQRRIMPIDWNLKKVLHFPVGVVVLVVFLEVMRSVLHLHMYTTASISVVVIIIGLSILYRNELRGISRKYLNRKA